MAQWRRERPDLDVSPQGVIGRLHRLAARLTEELVAVYAEFGLGEGEFDVLATLRRAGAPYELTPGELAAAHDGHVGGGDQAGRPAGRARAGDPARGRARRPGPGDRADRRRAAT